MPAVGFSPHARFFFPRPYVNRWVVYGDWPSGTFEDNTHIGRSLDASDWYFYVIMKENVWDWSSNMYSLDYILEDAYATSIPLGITVPLNMEVIWQPNTTEPFPYLQFNRIGATTFNYVTDIPAAPSDYWLQPNAL